MVADQDKFEWVNVFFWYQLAWVVSDTQQNNRFTALWTLSRITQMSQYQKKHSRTHTCFHQSSLICFLHLLQSMASSLFNLRAWQSFSTISKFSLVYLLAWQPST